MKFANFDFDWGWGSGKKFAPGRLLVNPICFVP